MFYDKITKNENNKYGQIKLKIKKTQEEKIMLKKQKGITLIALVVTTIFSYDENVKSSNNKGFLLQTI